MEPGVALLKFSFSAIRNLQSAIGSRLLLRNTMNRPETPHQITARDTDDLTVGKQLLQGSKCPLVVRAGVGGQEHNTIGNVEVRVTRGEPVSFVFHRAGH